MEHLEEVPKLAGSGFYSGQKSHRRHSAEEPMAAGTGHVAGIVGSGFAGIVTAAAEIAMSSSCRLEGPNFSGDGPGEGPGEDPTGYILDCNLDCSLGCTLDSGSGCSLGCSLGWAGCSPDRNLETIVLRMYFLRFLETC